MRTPIIALAAIALCLGAATVSSADHHEGSPQEGQAEAGMPAMGPPPEMKALEAMNGEYAIKFFYKMDPMSEEWMETDATAVMTTVAGGGAQQMVFEGQMMGMPFSGIGLTSYDRVTQKYQTTWVDSMGARISIYTGDLVDGKLVVTGTDPGPAGGTYHSRLTNYNMTDAGFDWTYEMSEDGTNYVVGAKATYTKK